MHDASFATNRRFSGWTNLCWMLCTPSELRLTNKSAGILTNSVVAESIANLFLFLEARADALPGKDRDPLWWHARRSDSGKIGLQPSSLLLRSCKMPRLPLSVILFRRVAGGKTCYRSQKLKSSVAVLLHKTKIWNDICSFRCFRIFLHKLNCNDCTSQMWKICVAKLALCSKSRRI